MRLAIATVFLWLLAACGAPTDTSRPDAPEMAPPPLPEDAETVVFERTQPAPETPQPAADSSDSDQNRRPVYWGVAPGDPLPIMWEDLMPVGAMEDVIRQQEEFYAMLQKRYAANATTLADADPFSAIEEGSELDYMPQFGNFEVVEDLDGERVRIPGYVVPFDFNPRKRHREFLFVPYMGACIHTPPPPPNQIIFVRADPMIQVKDIWAPYWLQGTLSAEQNLNDLGDAAYSLALDTLEPYPVFGPGP